MNTSLTYQGEPVTLVEQYLCGERRYDRRKSDAGWVGVLDTEGKIRGVRPWALTVVVPEDEETES